MDEVILTWYQALQLLALGPCLFMMFFLCVATRSLPLIFVPILYFLSLACSFCLPLLDTLEMQGNPQITGILMMGTSMAPAMSFLLIIQFLTNRIPPPIYWFILAIPLVGGSSIIYSTALAKGEVCIYDQLCTTPEIFRTLYEIFSSSLTFLLTVVMFSRLSGRMQGTEHQRTHKQALIIALIVLNLAILGVDLARISKFADISPSRADFAITVIRIGFIYLVLTSVFRVFDNALEIDYERIPVARPNAPSTRDLAVAEEIRLLMDRDKLYRSMDLSREVLAAKLAVTEHALSRIINQCLGQNFNTLVNQYRVEDAKQRLAAESAPVTTIAFEVGFASLSSFNRVFKHVTDMSATQYRASQQKK